MKRNLVIPSLLGLVGLIASVILLQNAACLRYNPFASEYGWDYPTLLASDASGAAAIVDGRGQRLVFIDGDGRVAGIVREGDKKDAFRHVSSLAVSSNGVYVADCQAGGGGKYSHGCRIARYSHLGEYLGTVYSETFAEPILNARALSSLRCHDGRLYAIVLRGGRLKVVEIAEGKFRDVRDVPVDWKRVRGAWYVPERRLLVVTTFSREVWLFEGEGKGRRIDGGNMLVQDVDVAPDGTCMLSDRASGRLLELARDNSVRELAQADVRNFCRCGSRLLAVSFMTRPLLEIDPAGGSVRTKVASPIAPDLLGGVRLAWLALCACALVVLVVAVRLLLCRWRRRRERAASVPTAARPLDMLSLYLANLIVVVIAFALVTGTLTVARYRDEVTNVERTRRRISETLYNLSPIALGESIRRIDPATGCDGRDYDAVRMFVGMVGDSGRDVGTDLGFMVLRLPRDGEPYCLTSSLPWPCSFGDRLTDGERATLLGDETEARLRGGEICTLKSHGVTLSAVPLRDRAGEVLAVAYLHQVVRSLDEVIARRLVDSSVDLFAQLLVLVMLLGECRLLAEFFRLYRERKAESGPVRTQCEAHRTIRVIQNVLPTLFMAFLPTLAREQAQASGLSAGFFFTLPLVIAYGGDYFFRFLLCDRAQRAVRRSYQIGCAACAVASAIVAASAVCGGYWMLVGGIVTMSLGTSLVGCGNTALRACGLQPGDRHRLLVFTNMEPAIGAGIGAALGAFLYEKFGLVSVGVCGILLALAMWTVVRIFVHSDVDRRPAPVVRKGAGLALVLRFVLRPPVLAIVFCMVFPITILTAFQSYALPVFNSERGNSVVIVGFALLVAQIAALFAASPALRLVDRFGNRRSMVGAMVLTLGTLLVYALMPGMCTMMIVILCNNLLLTVVATCAEREEIALADAAGVPFASVASYLLLGEGLACAFGAPIFSGLMAGGFAFLGFAIFFVLLALLAVFLFATRRASVSHP